ncbi:Fc receptor-like protein 2 isoform X2 [Lates calcarifer]|uniref:Fc receptor-like protein 2 isoform X2 n=1 Tax=Lates calcarifer TaxID=8187 RepID=A0AAJ8B3V2_LATCA|nr:Fc receptor-like protein 2 isoform X2 [Lates calcarifer]
MKTPSVSLLLGVSVLLLSGLTVSAVSLNVSPNRLQFFEGESVSLRCEGQVVSDGQTVKRTRGGQTEDCGPAGSGFGRFDGFSCIISGLSVSDSGGYWCEDRDGQRRDEVSISVFLKDDHPFILEIPALPVMTGSDVTLRCRSDSNNRPTVFFYKDGVLLGSGPDGELPLSKVQQSHEGLYWCSTDLYGSSPQSRLRVRDSSAI